MSIGTGLGAGAQQDQSTQDRYNSWSFNRAYLKAVVRHFLCPIFGKLFDVRSKSKFCLRICILIVFVRRLMEDMPLNGLTQMSLHKTFWNHLVSSLLVFMFEKRVVESELDIDGDGQSKAFTDGLLLIRYLFGFSGDSLTAGAIGEDAERTTAEEIQAYIGDRIPSE